MANSQQPDEPLHHGRMSPDEMEAAIRDLLARVATLENWLAQHPAAQPEATPPK